VDCAKIASNVYRKPVPRYFIEIGLRYLGMAAPTIAIGYVLQKRSTV
jgi:hypothetical protein